MSAPVRIVSPMLRGLAVALWIVAVALLPIGLASGGFRGLALAPVPSAFTAFFAWAVLWRPRIELHDDALVIVDVRRRTRFAWSRVLEVRSRHGLEVRSSEGVRRTWIAPTARVRLRALPGGPLSVEAAASVIAEHVPEPVVLDGPPPVSVVAAPIVSRAQGWSVLLLVALGIAASMTAARL